MHHRLQTVTRAADILRSAGIRIVSMPTVIIDPDEHEEIRQGLINRQERHEGDTSVITGNHEDHGRVTLRRQDGVFSVEAEGATFVRARGEPIARQ